MNVYIVTQVRKPELIYGSTLVFDSLRRGFPNAQIHVTDNGSIGEGQAAVLKAAGKAGCEVACIEGRQIPHHDLIRQSIVSHAAQHGSTPMVLLDPDVVFWDTVEPIVDELKGLLCGLEIPQHWNEVTQCMEAARLHTSLLVINDAMEFLEREKLCVNNTERHPFDAISPRIISHCGQFFFYDTMAMAYHADFGVCPFNGLFMDAYDHLGCGSMIDRVAPKMEAGEAFAQWHKAVARNPRVLRGYRTEQNSYYEARQKGPALRCEVA